jgi:hypothetical protein
VVGGFFSNLFYFIFFIFCVCMRFVLCAMENIHTTHGTAPRVASGNQPASFVPCSAASRRSSYSSSATSSLLPSSSSSSSSFLFLFFLYLHKISIAFLVSFFNRMLLSLAISGVIQFNSSLFLLFHLNEIDRLGFDQFDRHLGNCAI